MTSQKKCGYCGKRGLHWCLDIDSRDYSRTPGVQAVLRFGPFEFYVNTADDRAIGFTIVLAGRSVGWSVG